MTDKLLIVTATAFEVQPTLERHGVKGRDAEGLGCAGTLLESSAFDCLITGVGQLQCAFHLTSLLRSASYRGIVQAGLAGSFNLKFPKGSVVSVGEEVLGDFGAESGSGYLDIGDMGLLPPNQPPFREGTLRNIHFELLGLCGLPVARSVTVNRTLASPQSIGWVQGRYAPDVVNMEGAALFYACLALNVPFLEVRGISDMVGPRDKATWDIPAAVRALNEKLVELIKVI